MALTGLGGVLGVGLVQVLVVLVRRATSMKAAVPLWAVVVGLGVSLAVD